jgi:hypothetical protein
MTNDETNKRGLEPSPIIKWYQSTEHPPILDKIRNRAKFVEWKAEPYELAPGLRNT